MVNIVNQVIRKSLVFYLVAFFMATCATYFYWSNQQGGLNNAQVTLTTINDVMGGLFSVQQALTALIFTVLFVIWGAVAVWRINKDANKDNKALESFLWINKGKVKIVAESIFFYLALLIFTVSIIHLFYQVASYLLRLA